MADTPLQNPQIPAPREPWGWTRRQRIGLGMLATLLLAILIVQFARRSSRLDDQAVLVHGEQVVLPQRINPNTATVQELTRIPHLGEALAANIIAYRDARKGTAAEGVVFRSADDLDKVPEIGPKLVKQFEPFMEFPEAATRE